MYLPTRFLLLPFFLLECLSVSFLPLSLWIFVVTHSIYLLNLSLSHALPLMSLLLFLSISVCIFVSFVFPSLTSSFPSIFVSLSFFFYLCLSVPIYLSLFFPFLSPFSQSHSVSRLVLDDFCWLNDPVQLCVGGFNWSPSLSVCLYWGRSIVTHSESWVLRKAYYPKFLRGPFHDLSTRTHSSNNL